MLPAKRDATPLSRHGNGCSGAPFGFSCGSGLVAETAERREEPAVSRSRALLVVVVVVVTAATACRSDRTDDGAGGTTAAANGADVPDCPTEGGELADTKLYIEHNATDGDTGVHALLAADGWTTLCLTDPNGQRLVVADPQGPLGELGVADLFWESREPENREYSIADLEDDFPEGEYLVSAVDFEGNPLAGTADFTHDIPAPPTIISPSPLAEDAETAGDVTTSPEGFVVRWKPVTETIDGGPLTVTAYEVIITDAAFVDPHGFAQPIYDVHVGPEARSLSVPPEFFEPTTVYEVEVLALEESGNQTISLGFFTTP
jgi:hypothetical protein